MLFLMYFEVNENMSSGERLEVAQKLTSKGLFPPKGINIIRWDTTPDGWGISIFEAENAAAVNKVAALWRTAKAGIFKCTKISPTITAQESQVMVGELMKTLGS